MKNIFAFIFTAICLVPGVAQHTIEKSSGKLKVTEVAKVTFQGHTSNNIIIEIEGGEGSIPERAQGLRLLSPKGLTDNTGIGLSIATEGDETIIRKVSTKEGKRYTIKVPAGVAIFYEHSNHDGGRLEIKDLSNEVEASVNYNDVLISNASGPLAINSVYGSIEADFEVVNQDHAINLYSVYDHVDVTVPASTKANFKLATSYGEMFTDLDLDFGNNGADMKQISADKVVGKLNGGGVDFSIKSSYDDVYLRKK